MLVQDALEGSVLGGVVGGAFLPAAPDDQDPGAGQDAGGVRVVLAAVAGGLVDGRGPGAGVPGAGREVADGIAEPAVDRPPESMREGRPGLAVYRPAAPQRRPRLRPG